MSLLNWYRSVEAEMDQVARDARQLRASYGPEAEQWCEVGLVGVAGDAAKRRRLEQIRRALRHLD